MAENNNNNLQPTGDRSDPVLKGITASIATVLGEAGDLLKRAPFADRNHPEGFIYAWGTDADIDDDDPINFVYTQSETPSVGDAVWHDGDYGVVVSRVEESYFANSKITILTPEDKEYLKSKTAYVLKDNPTQDSRMSAKQIKAKLYEGILQLFDWLVATQTELNDVESDIYNALSNVYTKEEVNLIKDRINSLGEDILDLQDTIIRKISELNDVESDIYNALSNVYTKEEVYLIKNSLESTISRLWDEIIYDLEFWVNRDDYLIFNAYNNTRNFHFRIPPATQTIGGIMSRYDKTKLDNLQPTEEHNADIYAHAFIRQLIEDLQREINRLDAKGRSWGELNITHDELVALSDTERNNAIVNDIQARFPNYVRKVGDMVYTKRVTDTPEHEWEWNGINWVDNGAWLIEKATNDAYGLVKGDNNYLSIINGLIQVLKADYATNIGDTTNSYTYDDLLSKSALSQNVIDDKNNTTKVPSAKAVYDHTESAILSFKGDNYSLWTKYKHATDEDFIVHDGANGLFTYIGDDEYIILPEKINGYNLWTMRGENNTGMFSGNISIKGVACFGNNLTRMDDAFKDMPFTSIDLRFLNTSNSANFARVFQGCQNLTELDLSSWDTSKVIYMQSMFNNCAALRELDLSNWDTSNATHLYNLFYRCENLTELDLSSWDTSSVTTARSMFYNCAALRELDISEFTHEVMEDITYMFSGVKDCTVYFKNQEEIDFFTQPGAAGDPHWHSSNIAIIKGA